MKIIITGATKGIGRAIAHRFAAAGFHIAAIARTSEELEQLESDIKNQYPGADVLKIRADISQKSEIEHAVSKISASWQEINILVNNAGLYLEGRLFSEPDNHLEQMIALNLMAPYHLSRAIRPLIPEQGHIFNICSVASHTISPDNASYAISKHALLAMNKAMRMELLESSVKVTAVLPGPTWTSSWEGAPIPESRLMPPEDIASAVWNAWQMSDRTVVEEVILRPQRGDL